MRVTVTVTVRDRVSVSIGVMVYSVVYSIYGKFHA